MWSDADKAMQFVMTSAAIFIGILAMEFFNIFSTPPTRWLYEMVAKNFF